MCIPCFSFVLLQVKVGKKGRGVQLIIHQRKSAPDLTDLAKTTRKLINCKNIDNIRRKVLCYLWLK